MSPIIATEIVSRIIIWVFLFSADVITADVLLSVPLFPMYYPTAALLTTTTFVLLLRFKDSDLVWDIRELSAYEVIFSWLGFILFLNSIPPTAFIVMQTVVNLLRLIRLVWMVKKPDGSGLEPWPVFGLIGLWRRKQLKAMGMAYTNNKIHDQKVYWLLFFVFLLSAAAEIMFQFKLKLSYVAFAIVWLITLLYNRFISYLYEQNQAHIATVKALAVQKATAKANAALVTASIQREQMLRELAKKNDELREANKQREAMLEDLARRNEILRDASHDLAQPLMGISYYARKLTEAQTQEEHDVFGDKLLTAVAGLGNLIDDTIHNAKITTKLEAPLLAPVSVEHLADQLWAQYLNAAHRKGIGFTLYKGTLSLPVDPHDPKRGHRSALDFHIATDENIVWRIISNLVINAINHTEHGRILVAFRRRGRECWIEVRDSGSGIEHANGPDWDANFQHFAESIKRRYGTFKKGAGHGLGINNVKQLCSTIDTQMLLYSHPGRGSIFRFVVPLICPIGAHADHGTSDSDVTLA